MMLTTRSICLGAAVAAALCVSSCSKEPPPAASEPPAATPAASEAATSAAAAAAADGRFYELRIGELTGIALSDGSLAFANDAKTFGMGRSTDEIAGVLRTAGVATGELALDVTPLLVKAGDRVLLFDTGTGAGMSPGTGRLPLSMRSAGIDPEAVTDVFISHAHGDHIGGLLGEGGAAVFPNATIHLSAPEWKALQGVDDNAALVAAIKPKVDAFAPGAKILDGLVTAVEIKGHTPGHSGYLIGEGTGSLLYIGDTAHHYVVSVQRPDWRIAFDGDAPVAQASRRALIEKSAAAGQRIYAVHFPFPGVGRFVARGEGYAWVPEN